MAIQLNHTIVAARDKDASAHFLTGLLGLADPVPYGPFLTAQVDNEVTLDFMDVDGDIAPQHYAFLVDEHEFDDIFGKITSRGMSHWADPGHTRPEEINHNDGGRGVYFEDLDGHNLELLTRPYGSGG